MPARVRVRLQHTAGPIEELIATDPVAEEVVQLHENDDDNTEEVVQLHENDDEDTEAGEHDRPLDESDEDCEYTEADEYDGDVTDATKPSTEAHVAADRADLSLEQRDEADASGGTLTQSLDPARCGELDAPGMGPDETILAAMILSILGCPHPAVPGAPDPAALAHVPPAGPPPSHPSWSPRQSCP